VLRGYGLNKKFQILLVVFISFWETRNPVTPVTTLVTQ